MGWVMQKSYIYLQGRWVKKGLKSAHIVHECAYICVASKLMYFNHSNWIGWLWNGSRNSLGSQVDIPVFYIHKNCSNDHSYNCKEKSMHGKVFWNFIMNLYEILTFSERFLSSIWIKYQTNCSKWRSSIMVQKYTKFPWKIGKMSNFDNL